MEEYKFNTSNIKSSFKNRFLADKTSWYRHDLRALLVLLCATLKSGLWPYWNRDYWFSYLFSWCFALISFRLYHSPLTAECLKSINIRETRITCFENIDLAPVRIRSRNHPWHYRRYPFFVIFLFQYSVWQYFFADSTLSGIEELNPY